MEHINRIHDISGQRVSGEDLSAGHDRPDPEVLEKKPRRKFTAAYKLRILKEFDACVKLGEKGALLRREGLYHSNICTWRRQREEGQLKKALSPKKRGRKAKKANPLEQKVLKLERENRNLQEKLRKAEIIIDVQKKFRDDEYPSTGKRKKELMKAASRLGQEVSKKAACKALGVSRATYYRHISSRPVRPINRPTPPLALTENEQQQVLDELYSERFLDQSPMEVYATLLDEGKVSLFYKDHVPDTGQT